MESRMIFVVIVVIVIVRANIVIVVALFIVFLNQIDLFFHYFTYYSSHY